MIVLNEQVSRVVHPIAQQFWAAGPVQILTEIAIGFFCSSQCPGSVILKTFDAVTALRNQGATLVGGFHSPMEWECLGILLRGRQTHHLGSRQKHRSDAAAARIAKALSSRQAPGDLAF